MISDEEVFAILKAAMYEKNETCPKHPKRFYVVFVGEVWCPECCWQKWIKNKQDEKSE